MLNDHTDPLSFQNAALSDVVAPPVAIDDMLGEPVVDLSSTDATENTGDLDEALTAPILWQITPDLGGVDEDDDAEPGDGDAPEDMPDPGTELTENDQALSLGAVGPVPMFRGVSTRAVIGMASPRSISRRITPAKGGVCLHYGGGTLGITELTPHAKCERVWRSWQSYHMKGHGWADIAYTFGACQHGFLLPGRGVGVRTAAQGTNAGNDNFYAVVFIGGGSDVPTGSAELAIRAGVALLRKAGAGDRVIGHRDLKSTTCPGEHVIKIARRLDRRPVAPAPADAPTSQPKPRGPFPLPKGHYFGARGDGARAHFGRGRSLYGVRQIQAAVGAKGDGIYGPDTKRRVSNWQAKNNLGSDGLVGEKTWAAMVKKFNPSTLKESK